jgi:undecaprenyl-diphosphatase
MSYWEAILLGIIQGLTEFLPVSSSGHLVVLQRFFNHDPSDPVMILFDLAVHLGTVIAVLIYYRDSLQKYFSHLYTSSREILHPLDLYQESISVRVTVLALAATFSTGLFYVFFHDAVEEGFASSASVGICWLVTATLLLVTDRRKDAKGSLKNFGLLMALTIGLAQGFALFPGISRSGSTICVAVLFGLRRRWAGEFSFLIGVPAILGATLIKGIKFFTQEHGPLNWGPMLVGGLVSGLVGLAALALLIWALKRAKLKVFAIYCYLVGTITLLVVYWPQEGV